MASLQCLFQKPGVKSRLVKNWLLLFDFEVFFLIVVFAMADKDMYSATNVISMRKAFGIHPKLDYLSRHNDPLMNCGRAIVILLLVFFGFFFSPAYAQVNLKTGYQFSILSTPELNRLVSDFNTTQSYNKSFRELHWLQGFEAGLRYKKDIHAIEITYQSAGKGFKADGIAPVTAKSYSDKIKYAIQSVGLGYQLGQGAFSLGTDLEYQWYKFTYTNGISGDEHKNFQHMTAFKFYLMVTLKGNEGIDFAIQPYMILPTKEYDLTPVAQILGKDTGSGNEKWIRYGLTVLFYNGSK